MIEAFSIRREFDFVLLNGLRRTTGRPPHEWDLYILKELIDNALDADERVWSIDNRLSPSVEIRVEYTLVPERRSQQLYVEVRNRTEFPVDLIEDIFDPQWYTSRKAFVRGLSRGALGNALKTLLGIPYALRHRSFGDWSPDLKPLSVLCGTRECLPHYVIDSTARAIQFEIEFRERGKVDGTVIRLGLDEFLQERPRALADISDLAEQYRLSNPHARFRWNVEIGEQEWSAEYAPDPLWKLKFLDTAPVQWYSLADFQNLLGALYRKQKSRGSQDLSVEEVCRHFAGFDNPDQGMTGAPSSIERIVAALGRQSLNSAEIEGSLAKSLYGLLFRHAPSFESSALGSIGRDHIFAVLSQLFPIDGGLFYEFITDSGRDPSESFVIEVAAAFLVQDARQRVWTAVNFTPTYDDPFLAAWLPAANKQGEPVQGLHGLLEAYDFREDIPVVFFLHLICPNVEHQEFSKTHINHIPFKGALARVVDNLLTSLTESRQNTELQLELTVFNVLDTIMAEMRSDERFIFDQLLEELRVRLSRDPILASWLSKPEAVSRLRTYITSYQSQNTLLPRRFATSSGATLSFPLHPKHHFSMPIEQITRERLASNQINKILFLHVRDLEPVVIDNNWLCQMDMALLHNPTDQKSLADAVMHCARNCDLPIAVLRNADGDGERMVLQMRTWLRGAHLPEDRIVDLGLRMQIQEADIRQISKIVEMMPAELATYLKTAFGATNISLKFLPPQIDAIRDIRTRFDHMLKGYLWEGLSHHLDLPTLLVEFDRQVRLTEVMISRALDERIRHLMGTDACSSSYQMILDEVVTDFFESVMAEYGVWLNEFVERHFQLATEVVNR